MKSPDDSHVSFKVGPLLLDGYRREARMNGVAIRLTETEFAVLLQLAEKKGGTVLREEFRSWRRKVTGADQRHPVDEVIMRLRNVLPENVRIKSVPGRGYRLGQEVPVTEVAGPSVASAERLRTIALDRMNIHTMSTLHASIRAYEEVLRQGPDADAYANLAISYINEGHVGFCLDRPQRTIPKARTLLEEAFSYYPNFSSGYALRALTYLIFDYDWDRAEKDLRLAFQANTEDEYAHLIAAHMEVSRGNFDEGIKHARRAAQLDWRSPMTVFTVPWMLVFAGRADQALLECEQPIKDFDPFAVGHEIRGFAWWAAGVAANAIKDFERSLEIAPFPSALAGLGHIHGLAGDQEQAQMYLNKLTTFEALAYVSGYHEALIHVGLGNYPMALTCLERALSEKADWLIYLNVDPRWAPISSESRFAALLEKVGLKKPATTLSFP